MSAWLQRKKSDPEAGAAARGLPSSKAVRVSELLGEDTVLFADEGQGKAALLEALVVRLSEKRGLPDPKALLAKVLEREQGISTTLDTGLSLPHARLDGLSSIVAAVGIAPRGISDPDHPGLPIRVMFLFFSPNRQEAFPLHLQLLRGVSLLFKPPLIQSLASASTPAQALTLIRGSEA